MENAKALAEFKRSILECLGLEPSNEECTKEEDRTFIGFNADKELNEVIQELLTKS